MCFLKTIGKVVLCQNLARFHSTGSHGYLNNIVEKIYCINILKTSYLFFSYHQKYYLQTHHKTLFKSLGIGQKDLMNSQIAAKLNGYVVGENTLEAFNAECENFGLSEESLNYVRKMIARGKQAHC